MYKSLPIKSLVHSPKEFPSQFLCSHSNFRFAFTGNRSFTDINWRIFIHICKYANPLTLFTIELLQRRKRHLASVTQECDHSQILY